MTGMTGMFGAAVGLRSVTVGASVADVGWGVKKVSGSSSTTSPMSGCGAGVRLIGMLGAAVGLPSVIAAILGTGVGRVCLTVGWGLPRWGVGSGVFGTAGAAVWINVGWGVGCGVGGAAWQQAHIRFFSPTLFWVHVNFPAESSL